jgi:hypothetical protein
VVSGPFKELYVPEAARLAVKLKWEPGMPIVFYDPLLKCELHVTLTKAAPSQSGVWLHWDGDAAQRRFV